MPSGVLPESPGIAEVVCAAQPVGHLRPAAYMCILQSCYSTDFGPAFHHYSLLGFPQHQEERLQSRAARSPAAAGCEQSRPLFCSYVLMHVQAYILC